MGKWAEGKVLSQKSWGLLKENKYFLWFPVIGFLLALIPLAIFGTGAIVLAVENANIAAIVTAIVGLIFVNFVVALSTAAMVASVDQEMSGTDSTVGYGFGKAFGRLGALFLWSLIQAAVSAILGLLRGNNNGAGAIAGNIIAALGAAAWSIVTFFVTPFIMLKGLGAVAAFKASVQMVREKWGTQVTGGVRIGLRLLIVVLPAIALLVLGFILIANSGATATLGLIAIGISILLFMVTAVLSAALRAIFSVALFHYTTGEGSYGPFTPQELQGVLTTK